MRSKRSKRRKRRSRVQKSRVTRKRAGSRRYMSTKRRNTKRYRRGIGHTLRTISEESRVPEGTQKLKKELTEALRSAYILEDVAGRRLTLFQIRDYVETIIDNGNNDPEKLENVLVILDKLALKVASNSFKNATTSKKRKKKKKKKE